MTEQDVIKVTEQLHIFSSSGADETD